MLKLEPNPHIEYIISGVAYTTCHARFHAVKSESLGARPEAILNFEWWNCPGQREDFRFLDLGILCYMCGSLYYVIVIVIVMIIVHMSHAPYVARLRHATRLMKVAAHPLDVAVFDVLVNGVHLRRRVGIARYALFTAAWRRVSRCCRS